MRPIDSINYIIDYIKCNNIDYVIPIARKGIRTFQLSSRVSEIQNKIVFLAAMEIDFSRFNGKKILIFDETARTGLHFQEIIQNISSYANKEVYKAKRKKQQFKKPVIRTAAIFVHEKCERGNRPEIVPPENILPDYEYDSYASELMGHLLASGKPLDVDHPIVTLEIDTQFDINDLKELMGMYGEIFTLPYSKDLGNVDFITMDFFVKPIFGSFGELPNIVQEGVMKIRIYWKEREIRIVPIFYPGILIKKNPSPRECDIFKNLKDTSFCKINLQQKAPKNMKNIICRQCVLHNINLYALCWFMSTIAFKLNMRLKEINENDYNATYFEKGKILQDIVWDRLNKSLSTQYNMDIFSISKIDSIKAPPLPKNCHPLNFVQKNLSKCFRVGETIRFLDIANELRSDNGNNGDNIKSFRGATFSQITELLNSELNQICISMSLDILLDTGVLKPSYLQLDPKQVFPDYPENDVILFLRTYLPAGEKSQELLDAMIGMTTDGGI
jgi:hypothetical protein